MGGVELVVAECAGGYGSSVFHLFGFVGVVVVIVVVVGRVGRTELAVLRGRAFAAVTRFGWVVFFALKDSTEN